MSSTLKKFVLWLIVGMFFVSAACVFAGRLSLEAAESQVRAAEDLTVKLASQYLRDQLSKPASHMQSIAMLEPAVQQAVSNPGRDTDTVIANALSTLLLRNPDYLQARWLSDKGNELVRVDRIMRSEVRVSPASELQNKQARSYVRFGRELEKGQVYVSPLDLNMENGRIQTPFVPVVRVAIRGFTAEGRPSGIFVLNIGAKSFLDHLNQFAPDNNLMLLNEQGFWLKGPRPADEWGFMLDRNVSFAARYPTAWQTISNQPSGQLETTEGLWTWETVAVQANDVSVKHNIALKSLTVVDAAHLQQVRDARIKPVFLMGLVLVILYGIGLHKILQEMESRRGAERDAVEANEAKSSFLATMSHEIRTPMTGVIGLADLLMDDKLSDESLFKVKRIRETAKALLAIINDILDLSKLDAGKFVIENLNFQPLDIANEVVRLFYMTCPAEKKAKLQINAEVADNFPKVVRADPTRLRQVLVNLVGNAVKFTDEGSVTLKCSHDSARRRLIFEVVDTGIGMEPETVDSLFDAFVQADASISRKYHGTGLGLAVCKRLIECMGGEIGVWSEPDKGSRFFFWVPYEPVAEHEYTEDQSENTSLPLGDGQGLSVLVAEDNAINQIIIRGLVEKMGHEPVFVGNGQEAVDAVQAGYFDIILMDVRMPVVSGPDATKMIRKLGGEKAKIPIIALTADLIAENKSVYLAAGMNDCVGKPIDPAELDHAIWKAVGNAASKNL
ncbi:ATP-binding protein [Kordiimonas aestuarii]|uniref:ATP-binding protein n=1 Tax=Kordiimonas aestuarii TaxID=1005925 RepID=UPI0021D0BCDA|nr:ATP-binding protein [Kordiimonas aestuarii]